MFFRVKCDGGGNVELVEFAGRGGSADPVLRLCDWSVMF